MERRLGFCSRLPPPGLTRPEGLGMGLGWLCRRVALPGSARVEPDFLVFGSMMFHVFSSTSSPKLTELLTHSALFERALPASGLSFLSLRVPECLIHGPALQPQSTIVACGRSPTDRFDK